MAFPLPRFFSQKNKDNANHKRAVNTSSGNWPDDVRTLSGATDIRQAGQTVSQRVAGLYINDPVVRSAVNLIVSQIVGSGVRLNTADQGVDTRFNALRIDPSALMSITAMQRAAIRHTGLCILILKKQHYAFSLAFRLPLLPM